MINHVFCICDKFPYCNKSMQMFSMKNIRKDDDVFKQDIKDNFSKLTSVNMCESPQLET